jgi:Rrf2 family protein
MLSQTAQYALRTVIRLAAGDEARWTVEQLAEELDVPRNYLSKTLHLLARAGVVESTRGKHGGFRLRRAPHRITLREVVTVRSRTAGLPAEGTCSDRNACPGPHAGRRCGSVAFCTTVAELFGSPWRHPLLPRLPPPGVREPTASPSTSRPRGRLPARSRRAAAGPLPPRRPHPPPPPARSSRSRPSPMVPRTTSSRTRTRPSRGIASRLCW